MGYRPDQRYPKQRKWDGNTHSLDVLGVGASGMVFKIDNKRVAKVDNGTPRSIEDIETEKQAYRKLGNNCHFVLECKEVDNPSGLVLEKCTDTVRKRLKLSRDDDPDRDETIRKWAHQAAKGLSHVHKCHIIQGDVGCHNMLLDSTDTVKIADFAGSSVDGSPATVDYELRSKLPGIGEPTQKSDIFALGSAMYEMATGSPPYQDKTWREVQGAYRRGDFPKMKNVPVFQRMPKLARIISDCWKQPDGYDRAQDVAADLAGMTDELDSFNSDSSSQVSSETESIGSPSPPGRKESAKYVNATNGWHRSPKYELDPDKNKGNEKHGYRKEKKRHSSAKSSSSGSDFPKLFTWLRPSGASRAGTMWSR